MSQTAQLPMKWHNFIVKFGLILSMLGGIVTAALVVTGELYQMMGVNAAYVYRYYDGLQMLDIMYAVVCVLCSVYAWQTRSAMKDFRRGAPSMLLTLYALNLGTTLLYNVAVLLLMRAGFSSLSSMGTTVVSSIAAIGLNRTYYQKRAHLFVH